jgi:hypothetical protein
MVIKKYFSELNFDRKALKIDYFAFGANLSYLSQL